MKSASFPPRDPTNAFLQAAAPGPSPSCRALPAPQGRAGAAGGVGEEEPCSQNGQGRALRSRGGDWERGLKVGSVLNRPAPARSEGETPTESCPPASKFPTATLGTPADPGSTPRPASGVCPTESKQKLWGFIDRALEARHLSPSPSHCPENLPTPFPPQSLGPFRARVG